MSKKSDVRDRVEKMCVELAANPLLVQGAGGNVSWKEKDTLWIKASGTWLADAVDEDIFIPTNIVHIRTALAEGNFNVTPIVTNESTLKPSIETLLHALMPQRIVIHLHAIDILPYLVVEDCELELKTRLSGDFNYTLVKYCKPGADLAKHVFQKIQLNENTNVIFLMNHGIVIGGDSVLEVLKTLDSLHKRLINKVVFNQINHSLIEDSNAVVTLTKHGYVPSESLNLHDLAVSPNLYYLLKNKWALFPDHVVFLGGQALIGSSDELSIMLLNNANLRPGFIFCNNVGTFQHASVTRAQIDQLNCFYDVAIRLSDLEKVVSLSVEDVGQLMDWDAEKYRLSIAKI